jgi:hypothetical protein
VWHSHNAKPKSQVASFAQDLTRLRTLCTSCEYKVESLWAGRLVNVGLITMELWNVASSISASRGLFPADAFGPFQLTKADWAKFRSMGNNKDEYSEADRLDPLFQVDAAAEFAFEATRELSQALTDPATGGGPTYRTASTCSLSM